MPIFGKLAYQAGLSTGALLLLRFCLAAAVLGALLLLRPRLRRPAPRTMASPRATASRPPGGARLVVLAILLGAVGYAAQAGLYFSALTRLDAPLVALVLYVYPALVTVAAVGLGRDRLTPRRAAALIVSSAGTLLVLLGAGGDVRLDLVGVALALGAAVTYTSYILVADRAVHRMPPVVLSAWVMTGASATLALHAGLTGALPLGVSLEALLWAACLAVVSTVGGMLAFFGGLRRSGPSTAAILSTFEPVVTTALAALVLQEFLAPAQLLGALVVLSSVAVLQVRPRRGAGTPAATVRSSGASQPVAA
jgi:drug/metabolite transporter (DMT)-like permease